MQGSHQLRRVLATGTRGLKNAPPPSLLQLHTQTSANVRRHSCTYISCIPAKPNQTSFSQTQSAIPIQTVRRFPRSKHLTTQKMSYSNTDTGSKNADPYKEKNLEDPSTEEKITDLTSFIERSKFGMMTTHSSQSDVLASRCMALAATEAGGIDLIFHTNTESGKTDDLKAESAANMSFYNSTGEWASLSGNAEIITDRSVVSKYYSPSLKAWLGDLGDGKHDGSENDPRIGVIRIKTKTATYAISRANAISRGIEMVSGAITGNAAQVNKLREISESEISSWRSSH